MDLKSMNTLIKLHKRRVDVLRREMVALEDERKQLTDLAERLREEHASEAQLAAEDAKMAGFFGAYDARMKKRQESIAQEVARIDATIAEKREAIRGEFSEQKKYEIARENMKKRLDATRAARIQERFDEIGSQQYLKLKDNPV